MLNLFVFSPIALEIGRGGEISSMELAAGLQDFYKVTFIDTNRFYGKKLLSKEAIQKKLKGVNKAWRMKYATISFFNKYFDFFFPSDLIKLYKSIKKCDIIYTSFSNFKTNLMFMVLSILHRRAKFIVGYRKPLYSVKLFSLYNIKYRLSILFFSLFKKRIYHHSLSLYAKQFLDNFYDSQKVKHIIHGIDLNDYIKNDLKKEQSEYLKFVYIGYLDDAHKGIGVLLKAIDQILIDNKNLKIFFEFCGMGPLASELRKLEKKHPKFIKYNGYINNDKIAEYYKKNDVYLFSSRREPFPRVLMEALAAKLVIICSKTIGSVELLRGKDFAFFIKELSPEGIKEKIHEVYELWKKNSDKFIELQNLGKEYVFENYSSTKELEMFRQLIDKISIK